MTNDLARHDLKALIAAIGARGVERSLNVHRTTVLRWASGSVSVPGAQVLAVRALLGDLPGTAGQWTGWRFHDGQLLSPEGTAFDPGEVRAIPLKNQLIAELRRELERLQILRAVDVIDVTPEQSLPSPACPAPTPPA